MTSPTFIRSFAGLALGAFAGAAFAQAPAAPPDPVVQALQARTAQLEAEIQKNEKEIALLAQKLPKIEGGKDGQITFQSGKGAYSIGVWGQVFEQVNTAAHQICEILNDKHKPTIQSGIVLVSDAGLADLHAYPIATAQLRRLERDVAALQAHLGPPKIGAAPATAPALGLLGAALTSGVSIAKLFRTDKALYPDDTTISAEALMDEVTKCLPGVNVANPAWEARLVTTKENGSKFVDRVTALVSSRNDADLKVSQLAAASRPAEAAPLFAQVDKFVADLFTSDSEPPLMAIVRGELLTEKLRAGQALLALSIAQQGGFSMISSAWWRADRLYVGGGAIVSYKLSGNENKVVASGVVSRVDPGLKQIPLK